jgi:hypothetical protein
MIFEQYTYKTKIKALVVVFCMLSFAAYKRSFSTLIDVVKENNELNKKVTTTDNQKNIKEISAEIAYLDKMIGKETNDKEKIQQDIISFVADNGKRVSIFELKSIHEFSDENHKIYTNQLDVTGNANDLLALSYAFEKYIDYSRLISLDFYTVKKNNNPDALHLKMIFQNYENNK